MVSNIEQWQSVQLDASNTLTYNIRRTKCLSQEICQSPILPHSTLPGDMSKDPSTFFERFEDPDILQRTILLPEGERCAPVSVPHDAEKAANAALASLHRYYCSGDLNDLEQLISEQRKAIQLTSDGYPAKHGYLRRLANSLLERFRRLGKLDNLEESISVVLRLASDDHREKPHYLSILGLSLLIHFRSPDELNDLGQSMSENTTCLGGLADALVTDFRCLGDPGDLDQAIFHYSKAARSASGPISSRFYASQQWILHAPSRSDSLLDAYSTAISYLPQLAWIGFSLTQRYHKLLQGTNMVREGAAAALDLGRLELAVEWLEQGRSVVWGEIFQLRSSFEELASAYPEHARQLQQLSLTTALVHARAVRNKISPSFPVQTPSDEPSSSHPPGPDEQCALTIERDKLLQVIRRFPGFERFLLHKKFSQLRAAAHSGPVVILNAAETRCDALVVLADREDIVHVPLADFTLEEIWSLQKEMDGLLGQARGLCGDRGKQHTSGLQFCWESLLSSLWIGIVKPVLDALDISTPGKLSRIFWCPTGPFTFLPIHAAGLYGDQHSEPGHKVFDFVISSYVPTLISLIPPRTRETSNGNIRILAVSRPSSDGQSLLPGVQTEMENVRQVIKDAGSERITLLETREGTVEEVLALMKNADWVHFACHGVQDSACPTNSGLCLAQGRRMTLSDIIALSRPHGGLAFLSACQTAMGDKHLSDEAVHIAAGMLFAGYGGVIATMWSISDRVAPHVAKDVYEKLFQTGKTPNYRGAALALHNAVGRLREHGASFVEWLPFIHVGL